MCFVWSNVLFNIPYKDSPFNVDLHRNTCNLCHPYKTRYTYASNHGMRSVFGCTHIPWYPTVRVIYHPWYMYNQAICLWQLCYNIIYFHCIVAQLCTPDPKFSLFRIVHSPYHVVVYNSSHQKQIYIPNIYTHFFKKKIFFLFFFFFFFLLFFFPFYLFFSGFFCNFFLFCSFFIYIFFMVSFSCISFFTDRTFQKHNLKGPIHIQLSHQCQWSVSGCTHNIDVLF